MWTILIPLTISLAVPGRAFTKYPVVESVFASLEQNWLSRLFLAPWYRFDTVHYLEIAGSGYSYPLLTVWAPFYPFLIRLVTALGIIPMAAALIVSNLACFLAILFIYLLAQKMLGMIMARKILLGMVIFPTSFFLVAGYTESLFILVSLLFFWFMLQKKWLWAGLFGILAALTRFQGAALALPAAWMVWELIRKLPRSQWRPVLLQNKTSLAAVFLPPIALAAWLSWVHFGLKAAWPWDYLNNFWDQHTGFPWEGILGNFSSLLGLRYIEFTPINYIAQAYDLLLVVIAIISLIIAMRNKTNIPAAVFIFAWINLLTILVKVDNQYLLVSASRYLLSVFPIFFTIPLLFSQKKIWLLWVIFSFFSQIFLLTCFYFWVWTA